MLNMDGIKSIVVVSGSRVLSGDAVAAFLRSHVGPDDFVFVGCARGVDAVARSLFAGRARVFRADWACGPSAGPRRNAEMVSVALSLGVPVRGVVVWDGASRGAAHCASLFRRFSVPYVQEVIRTN